MVIVSIMLPKRSICHHVLIVVDGIETQSTMVLFDEKYVSSIFSSKYRTLFDSRILYIDGPLAYGVSCETEKTQLIEYIPVLVLL